MDNNHDKLITNLVLIGAGYFLVLKPILDKTGITKSAEQKAIDAKSETATNSVGWDPTFYKTYMSKGNGKVQLHTSAFAEALATQIYRAWGLLNDDEEKVYAAIKQCRSLLELSQLCDKYSALYKRDLLGDLKAPWSSLHDGLSPDQFAYLAGIINKLPVAINV